MTVHVVAAVILDSEERVLIAERPADKHQGGLWEFPGGKVEPGERIEGALCRELEEELGILPSEYEPLIKIRYDYSDKSVLLDVWTVTAFSGEAHGREGQPIEWVDKAQLRDYEFPAANHPILNAAILPERYLITGSFRDKSELIDKVSSALRMGISLVQFRAPWLDKEQYRECVESLVPLFSGHESKLIVKGELEWLEDDSVGGIHLTSSQLESLHKEGWKHSGGKIVGVSCHSGLQLVQASEVGAFFATLSPVEETSFHPEANPLGWGQVGPMIENATLPVYCLGGMRDNDLVQACRLGAQGIAAISAWWS
ncbi:Nudix family hydrolase [Sansalvadorimonas sp. 2012CJ34-2]|uniref:8-oxo-dGTP diphosphatase n=1 Tax=Parendozoicomonas callyspongiae TaxID=2942213 RepID=A0ABT0PCB7_9GAMM|nr:Nudix family hydrolase [Sansalvadorimonas sp. 2012CJ34-2]MCL6268960.1 Nudix family hydrolase [Sansalvadorimonas sp. 2012CJ34-2]